MPNLKSCLLGAAAVLLIYYIIKRKNRKRPSIQWNRGPLERRKESRGTLALVNNELRVEDLEAYQNYEKMMKAAYRPGRMWIDGKCFNIKTPPKMPKKRVQTSSEELVVQDFLVDHGFEVTENKGKFSTNFNLPNFYYKQLSAYYNLKELAVNTKTIISLPPKTHQENIVITGDNEKSIVEARHELHTLIYEIRDKSKALQFIGIPTRGEKIVRSFVDFKEKVLQENEVVDGIEESIFQSPLKLHLTVGVFALMNEKEKEVARKILDDYKTTVIDPLIEKNGPLHIGLSGINCMNNNLKKVHVLYANARIINETGECNLQKFVNDLSDHFYKNGLLIRKPEDNVKLHMTLMNTKYRKTANSPKKQRWPKKQSFDATKIMEKYKDFHFGETQLNTIHLSQISTVGDDGFYKPLSVITF